MIKLIVTAGVAALLAGCAVVPDAGYGYGQSYYPDYAYGPAYAPAYGSVSIWGGGGGGWDRRRGDWHGRDGRPNHGYWNNSGHRGGGGRNGGGGHGGGHH